MGWWVSLNHRHSLELVLNTRDDAAICNSESDDFLRFRAQKGIPLEALVVQTVGISGVMYYASFEYLVLNLNKAKMRPYLAYGAVVSSGEESVLELCLCVCSARQ